VTKKGFVNKKQLYKCKDCGHRFYENGKFARMNAPNNWKTLIEEATKHEAELLAKVTAETKAEKQKPIEVIAK
jgi:predicted ATP-dependent serine protease